MTRRGGRSLTVHPYFNPHSPCGERLLSRLQLVWLGLFQSTLPLRGATPSRKRSTSTPSGFQSTLPLRGATEPQERSGQPQVISIHTPLAGSDCGGLYARHTECRHFNPHSPCGERPTAAADPTIPSGFQSTLPLRGATFLQLYVLPSTLFQSTLPLRGATCTKELCDEIVWQFQSTLPLRGATHGFQSSSL